MEVAVIVAFAFLSMFTFCEDTYALPDEAGKVDTMKNVKEPKDIKEAATPSKEVKDAIKAAKDAKKNKKDCQRDCGTNYDPVCAHDPTDSSVKTRTFGTQCNLDVHNCETGSKLVVKSKGECPGSGGVRLS
ncbi:PREDICTED: agrin [Wasmannia auropunctata]|uniref:agrin n=1 Tax=Wasmannia auropunctata TaxID=64793 RepID=UPI0005EE3210|nr:PREDICTED: agrin [Wasmannia auropunctata]